MTTMTRRILSLVLVVLLALLAGCGPESTSNRPGKAPAPGAAKGGAGKGNPDVDKPNPVQADPQAHNTQPGYVVVFVTWKSENRTTPTITFTRNGVPLAKGNVTPATQQADGLWHGDWEWEGPGSVGETYAVTGKGRGLRSIACEIGWKGQFHSDIQTSSCAMTLTLN